MTKAIFAGSTALAMLLAIAPAAAQTATPSADAPAEPQVSEVQAADEIVVTANKRAERIQDVPMSISALTSDQIKDLRITNALDLNNVAPGLRISSGDAAANPKIFIRGVGLADFNPSSSSGVGIYVDGVYIGSPLAQLSGLYDIARIEVLRGPQGTLYGRNTSGGAINIITNRPTQEFTADASIDYGRYDSVNLNAGIGGPIIKDLLAFRVAGQLVRDDGYTENRTTGDKVNNNDRWAIRGSLLFTPSSDIEVLAQGSFFRNRGGARQIKHRSLFPNTAAATGPDGLCAPGYYFTSQCTDALGYSDTSSEPNSIESNLEGKDRVDVTALNLQATWHMGAADLVSITAYQDAWRDDVENTDASPLQMIEARYHSKQRTFSEELRLQSAGQTPFRWVVGGYYAHDSLHDRSSYDVLRALRPLFVSPTNPLGISPADSVALFSWPYTQKTDSYAVFGQLDYDLTSRLTLTAGLRWSSDTKKFDYVSQVEDGLIVLLTSHQKKTFSDWSGRLGLNYKLSDVTRVYATYNRGYKSGGFFGGQATNAYQLEPYDNETLDAYEAGLKTEFFDRRIRANIAAFYYDYKNQQVFAQALRNGVTTQILDNAASSRVYGGELEVSGKVTERLSATFGAAYLNTKIRDYVSEGEDYSGNVLQHSPKWSLDASLNYSLPLAGGSAIVANVDANYRTRIYFDNTQRLRLSEGPKTLVNGQIGWRSPDEKFEGGVFARNLLDTTYLLGISNIDSLGVDLLSYAEPRVVGVYARLKY